ncbi:MULTISPECIES: SEC-C metal-binding domain-containing protein [Bacillus]
MSRNQNCPCGSGREKI